MKKLVMLFAVAVLAVACMPKLPDLPEVVTLKQAELPVVEQENEIWQSDAHMGKPVLVVFMGSWCPWCKKTMPAVNALSDKYAGKVEVVGVFMDRTPGPVRDAAQEHGFTAKALYNGSEVAEAMKVSGLPHTMLFDKQHRVVKVWEGYRPNMEELVSVEIDKLVK